MARPKEYSRTVIGGSDEVKEIYCDPCLKKRHKIQAKRYCLTCTEYLCGQCYKIHNRNKLFRNHVLKDVDLMSINSDSHQKKSDKSVEKCSIHPNELVEYFCEKCDMLTCNVCVTLNHQLCRQVSSISDFVKELDMKEMSQYFDEFLRHYELELGEIEENNDIIITSNNEMRKLAKQEITRQRAKINTFFNQLEKKIETKIAAIDKQNKNTLKAASDRLDAMKKNFYQVKNDNDAKKKRGNCEKFIAIKKGEQKMKDFYEQYREMWDERRIQRYKLLPSDQIEAMMRSTTEICKTITARLEAKINTRTSTYTEEENISGITIMHRHFCVAADFTNRYIKVIDTENKCVTSEISVDSRMLKGLTKIDDEQVVLSVVLPDRKNQIQFFKVSETGVIHSTKKYDVDDWYQDLSYCNGNLYALMPAELRIINLTGDVIRTIISVKDEGENIGFCQQRIAFSPDKETIYVTNSENYSVTSMTLDGKVKAEYKHKNLRRPSSITVDNEGYVYVYVLSVEKARIYQLTGDLRKVQFLTDGGVKSHYVCPLFITENKLYTGIGKYVFQFALGDSEV